MKKLKNSFLFFFVILGFLHSNKTKGQQANDSVRYYYNLYIEGKESTDFKKVYKFYLRNKELNSQKKDTLNLIYDLRIIASIQYKYGSLHESDATAVNAIELLSKMKNTDRTIEAKNGLLNHLGLVSYELGNYNRSIELYDRALKLAKTNHQKNIIYNNKAIIYKKNKNYELALVELRKVYLSSLKSNNNLQVARSLDNLGLVKSKLNYKDALVNMLDALEIRQKENNLNELFVSYKHLAEYYFDRNDIKKVNYYANKAYNLAVKAKNVSYKLEALSLLIEIDPSTKVSEYKKLTDSISANKRLNENKFTSIKYDYSEERRKAEEAKLRLVKSELKEEKQKRLKIIYLFLGLFIFLFSIFLYFLLKSRHKKEKLLEVYRTETRISKKVHDEVANDVYHVITKLQSNYATNEEVLDNLEGIYNKTREISKENSTIEMDENFDDLLKDLLLSYRNEKINVITKDRSKVDWLKVSNEKKTALYRILQELMTNMKKHSNASIVVLTFNQGEKLTVNYSDNGIGCVLKKGNGLQNTENRIKSINGTIIFESQHNEGFKAKIIV